MTAKFSRLVCALHAIFQIVGAPREIRTPKRLALNTFSTYPVYQFPAPGQCECLVGVVGVEPTKPEATDLQSAEFTDTQYPDIGVCSGTRTRITPSCFMRAEVPLLRLQTLVRRGRNRTSCPEGGGLQPPDGTSLSLLAHRIVWYGWRDSNPQERRLLKPLAVPIYLSHTRIVLLVRGERIELQALREMIYSHPIAPAILIDTPECLVPSSGFEPEKALPFERSGCTNLPKPAGHWRKAA